jgi:hypothetical protein
MKTIESVNPVAPFIASIELKKVAQLAIDLQNAPNINIVHAWAECIEKLHFIYPNMSTSEFNRLPVNVLFANKCCDLAGGADNFDRYAEAYDALQAIIAG